MLFYIVTTEYVMSQSNTTLYVISQFGAITILYVMSQFGELKVGVGVGVGNTLVGVGVGVGPNAFGIILSPPLNCIPMVTINSLFL
jgi:hypothetical protein